MTPPRSLEEFFPPPRVFVGSTPGRSHIASQLPYSWSIASQGQATSPVEPLDFLLPQAPLFYFNYL